MTTIYLVQGVVAGEFTEAIRAFTDEGKACKFVELCENYDKTRVNTKAWKNAHPAGSSYYDYYSVEYVELLE